MYDGVGVCRNSIGASQTAEFNIFTRRHISWIEPRQRQESKQIQTQTSKPHSFLKKMSNKQSEHLETNCSNCLHKWFSNRPVPQAISGRLHEINSQTGWMALIVFTLSISLYSPMFTICSVNFEQLGPNRVLEKLDFGAHCTALLKLLEKQRRAQFCRNQGTYVPCRYESSE